MSTDLTSISYGSHGEGEDNYWNDYEGKVENGDRIGDTPQPVPSNGVDNYPLMEPIRQ